MRILFGNGRKSTESCADIPLKVNNCGWYRDLNCDMEINRPNGRVDYHLLFVAKGEFIVDGITYTSGHCALYRPNEPHSYCYKAEEGSVFYWVHFTGSTAENAVKNFSGRCVSYENCSHDVNNLLEMMINACVNGGEYVVDFMASLLSAICVLLCKKQTQSPPFLKAIALMKDFQQNATLSDYAQACCMSEGHFSRSFKEFYGIPPQKYRVKLQVDHAKFLLSGTSLKISAVASLSGFSDPLYFSRVFKKTTGYSPDAYRKNIK